MVDKQSKLTAILSTLVLLGLIVSSCGEEQDQAEAPEAVEQPTASAEGTLETTEEVALAPSEDVDEGTESAIIGISHNAFQPAQLFIAIGETVRFQNLVNMPGGHTVMADDRSFTSPALAEGEVWRYTFDVAGTYDFHNHQHPNVKGSVTVGDGAASASDIVAPDADAADAADAFVEALRLALANPSRADQDKARDAGRKPADVIGFLGITEGMTVMDLMASAGYYTEVLSNAVGATGTVYAQNPAAMLQSRGGAGGKALAARLADNRLANVVRWDQEFGDIGLEPDSIDAAITALNFHDIYNRDPDAAADLLSMVRVILKPGGVFGIVDHAGNPEENNAQLHRIEEQTVIDAVEAAGFVVEATSDLLRNADDDRSKMVFDSNLRGKTDRFLLKLRNPS